MDFEGATNNGKSDIQYLIYLFMAEIETIRGNKGIIKYLSVFSNNKTIPNKDSIMWIRPYSRVQIQKQSIWRHTRSCKIQQWLSSFFKTLRNLWLYLLDMVYLLTLIFENIMHVLLFIQ
jgi:hypothetical protein